MFSNNTINQHYLSQADQRLNALNPDAPRKKKRIYEFKITDREKHSASLVSPRGIGTAEALADSDLFTFAVAEDGLSRENFEKVFERYERNTAALIKRVIQGKNLGMIEANEDLLELFTAKMVSFLRNPFCVAKSVDTFGEFAKFHPADPALDAIYLRVLSGKKPQLEELSQRYGLTIEQYFLWLRILFMSLVPMDGGASNLFDAGCRAIFFKAGNRTVIQVHTYTSERCLLSDRSITSIDNMGGMTMLMFNLAANAFVVYGLVDCAARFGSPLPGLIARELQRQPNAILREYFSDNLDALEAFNQGTLYQAHSRVFCSDSRPYGITLA